MQPISESLVRRLDLGAALTEEAAANRNLLPPEPGWAEVLAASTPLLKWLRSGLRAGWLASPQQTVAVRKAGHGVRPVPIWSIPDRIIYRAFVNLALAQEPPLDRSSNAYLEFVRGPHTYSEAVSDGGKSDNGSPFIFLFDSPFRYVVKSDITAFYQYVDHSILASELLLKGVDYDVIDGLMRLLQEVQGRAYGLPQLLDASDRLSELYIDRVERAMLRAGYPTWRYNDDFRIGCVDYPQTLNAIEQLDSAARENGLVISESKTFTYGYATYVIQHLGLTVTADQKVIAGDEVEDVVGDYTDEFGADEVDRVVEVISAAEPGAAAPAIDISEATAEQIRFLRRAFNGLASAESAAGAPFVKRLIEYIPSLTPTLTRYLVIVHPSSDGAALEVLDAVCNATSLNEWQKIWILHALIETNDLTTGTTEQRSSRVAWISNVAFVSSSPVTRAFAWRARAHAGVSSVDELVEQAENAPTCLQNHYLYAMRTHAALASKPEEQKRLDAVAADSVLNRALLT